MRARISATSTNEELSAEFIYWATSIKKNIKFQGKIESIADLMQALNALHDTIKLLLAFLKSPAGSSHLEDLAQMERFHSGLILCFFQIRDTMRKSLPSKIHNVFNTPEFKASYYPFLFKWKELQAEFLEVIKLIPTTVTTVKLQAPPIHASLFGENIPSSTPLPETPELGR